MLLKWSLVYIHKSLVYNIHGYEIFSNQKWPIQGQGSYLQEYGTQRECHEERIMVKTYYVNSNGGAGEDSTNGERVRLRKQGRLAGGTMVG